MGCAFWRSRARSWGEIAASQENPAKPQAALPAAAHIDAARREIAQNETESHVAEVAAVHLVIHPGHDRQLAEAALGLEPAGRHIENAVANRLGNRWQR